MKVNLKRKLTIVAVTLLLALTVFGCKSTSSSKEQNGKILLSVNPEIEIEYDKKGKVIGVRGVNDDGREVLSGYTGYVGKSVEAVTEELVDRINRAGYFDDDFNGHDKNLVVKVEKGSKNLGKKVAKKVAEEANKVMTTSGVNSSAIVVDFDDLDENGVINTTKAKELALTQLGLSEAQFATTEYELDDGIYEFKFTSDGYEYEYEVDAVTGKVLEADRERNDDWYDIDNDDFGDDIYDLDDDEDLDDDRYDDYDDLDDDDDDFDDYDDDDSDDDDDDDDNDD